MIHVQRAVERDLVTSLTTLGGYRQARWQAAILYGMAGIGKTAMARALADDDQIMKTFRDGIAWVDGSRDPEEEVMRLCLGFDLERQPGERWIGSWQRWAGAAERRLLLIIDDAISAEGLPPLIAELGPQIVALITTQQGAEIRAEVERWVPTGSVTEVGVHGLRSDEGKKLLESIIERLLSDPEWELVREIGELVGWHPEALRQAAIESRANGWVGTLGELQAGRMPWAEVNRSVMRQWARLLTDRREWLAALVQEAAPTTWLTSDDAACLWQVVRPVAERRVWILKHGGLMESINSDQVQQHRWRIVPIAHPIIAALSPGSRRAHTE